ncbi:hypothetical protein IGI04_036166, partial [Brassica rapa subsp. trilocularis]
FVHPTVPIRLTEPSHVRLDWSFGWNHVQTTKSTEPQPVFPDQLNILRPTVEPELAWVMKKPKTNMHYYPADHPDSPASVLIFTPCIHLPTHSFISGWLALDHGYIKSHSASLDDPFNPSQFQKCHCLLGSYPTPS